MCYPLVGCFTDAYPFSIPGYRPPRLPSNPDDVVKSFSLTNQRVKDQSVDWKNPTSGTSFTSSEVGMKIVLILPYSNRRLRPRLTCRE